MTSTVLSATLVVRIKQKEYLCFELNTCNINCSMCTAAYQLKFSDPELFLILKITKIVIDMLSILFVNEISEFV